MTVIGSVLPLEDIDEESKSVEFFEGLEEFRTSSKESKENVESMATHSLRNSERSSWFIPFRY